MSKNPFVNFMSHEQSNIGDPVPRPQVKLFCPRTMVRYDNLPCEYETMWVCKMCLRFLLSEEAAKTHLIKCNDSKKKITPDPQTEKDDVIYYTCETCNKVFSRHVKLKKHLKEHEKSSSDLESEQSD